ncbi:hypothetical protein Tco_1502089 [Tanacetum coccineum]
MNNGNEEVDGIIVDGRISYKEFQSTMKAGTEWKKASLGTLVSGFDDFPLEAAARNNGTGCNGYEYDAIVMFFYMNIEHCFTNGHLVQWLKKETEYVNSGSYQQQKKALAIVLTVGENFSQSPIGRSFLLIIIGLKDMLLHLIHAQSAGTDKSKITRKQSKTSKHGHENQKISKPKPEKSSLSQIQSKMVNKSQQSPNP